MANDSCPSSKRHLNCSERTKFVPAILRCVPPVDGKIDGETPSMTIFGRYVYFKLEEDVNIPARTLSLVSSNISTDSVGKTVTETE